jgi:dihydrofolate reductase
VRRITYGAACSLDGYIARPGGEVDWLHWSPDVQRLSGEYWQTVDTVLMGRKTYEVARAMGSGAYPGVTNYVFSKTLQADPEPNVRLVRENAAQFVAEMKGQPGGDICVMGGGELAQTLFEAGLIDEVGANIHPIILGSGVPLLRPLSQPIALELIRSETIAGGCQYVLYRVRDPG